MSALHHGHHVQVVWGFALGYSGRPGNHVSSTYFLYFIPIISGVCSLLFSDSAP